MLTSPQSIVRRFLSKVMLADDRFRPPLSIVNAVEEGKLDPHVLLFWKAVVDVISSSPQGWKGSKSYGAAVAYWRSKCAKNGYPLPKEFVEGLGGEGAQGRWSIKSGDEVEEWVKQTMLSQGLISTLEKTAAEWEMDIVHLQRELEEANEKVDTHSRALSKAKSDKGVAQRLKWLDGAKKDVASFQSQLDDAKAKLKALTEAAKRKNNAEVYAIEFEKEFQFLMMVAKKDLDKQAVLDSVKKAVERFEADLGIPGAESPAHDIERYKAAGVLDFLGGALEKAWNYLKGAFDNFIDWISGLVGTTKKIDSLLSAAGA